MRAARAARDFPVIFDMVARGELHLAAVTLLAPHLTAANHRELLAAAVHRSKRAVEELVAARFPASDVPASVRKLPAPRPAALPLQPTPPAPAAEPETRAPTALRRNRAEGKAARECLTERCVMDTAIDPCDCI